MRKIISIVVLLVLIISFFTGCKKERVDDTVLPSDSFPIGTTDLPEKTEEKPVEKPVEKPIEKTEIKPEPTPLSQEEALKIIIENFPRLDGSTSNIPLLTAIYSSILEIPIEEAELYVNVSGGTGKVWNSIYSKESSIAIVFDTLGNVMKAQGEYEVIPYGLDGLVFLVNSNNPVKDLSYEQLLGIYSGEYTNWNQVGGYNQSIAPYQRNKDSGSQNLFMELLMKDVEPTSPPLELVATSMGGLTEAVGAYDVKKSNAIGYSVYFYAGEMNKNPRLRLLSVNGIEPKKETISDKTYPFSAEFYIVIRRDEPDNSPVRLLRDFLLSEEGRKIVEAAGYIPAF